MDDAHHLVLLAGVPELPSVFTGLFSARFGTPILLVFLAIGMLFGKEGPVSLVCNCTQTAYLIGRAALAVNLGAQDEAQHKSRVACGGAGQGWSRDHRRRRLHHVRLVPPSTFALLGLGRS
jgi:hypothetical protein